MFGAAAAMVVVGSVVVVTVAGGDDSDDLVTSVDELLGPEARALIETAVPSPDCVSDPVSPVDDDTLVALDVVRVVDGCFTISTEWVAAEDVAARQANLAEEEGYVTAAVTPEFEVLQTPDRRDEQWALDALGVPQDSVELPWPTGAGVTVAVVDTGIDKDHPDLEGRVVGRNGFHGENSDELDPLGHGTHVAGIIAAQEDGEGTSGMAPGVTLLDAVSRLYSKNEDGEKVWHNESGPTTPKSIEWAVKQGADVINMSFGYSITDPDTAELFHPLLSAIKYAMDQDVVLVAGAGNCGCRELLPLVPALFDGVLSVGAAEKGPDLWDKSSRWDGVDLIAPGDGILSTAPGGEYDVLNGTSMAAPHVAAAAAIIRATNRSLTAPQVAEAITTSASPFWDNDDQDPVGAGAGMLDVLGALDHVEDTYPVEVPHYSVDEVAQTFPRAEANLPDDYSGLRTCATDPDRHCATDGVNTTISMLADRDDGGSVTVTATVAGSAENAARSSANQRRQHENTAEGPIASVKLGDWSGYVYYVDFSRGGDTAPAVTDTLHLIRGNVLLTVVITTPNIHVEDPYVSRLERLSVWSEQITTNL